MSELKVDVGHFKMIVDYYDRRCPCWGGKYSCPCPPFAETMNCRCGAVRTLDDARAQNPRFGTFKINFAGLNRVIKNGYMCPMKGEACFCEEFLKSGLCSLRVFEKPEK